MPKLDDSLHLDMYRAGVRRRSFIHRLRHALTVLTAKNGLYGLEWGDPEIAPPLAYIRDHFLLPYVTTGSVVLEIGQGGGRWTRYMLSAKRVYAVDYHRQILDEFERNFSSPKVLCIHNNGDDFPGVPDGEIDLVFSFGTFVHLDIDVIDRYLANMKRILNERAVVVIQYSDKTKPLGKQNARFSDNEPARMRALVAGHGYHIHEEDVQSLWHSSVIRFGL